MSTRKNDQARYQAKLTLIRMLYQKGYSKDDILELIRFIDWLMVLPKYLTEQINTTILEYERGNSMPYVTSFERLATEKGLEKGLQQGLQQGEVNLLLKQLKHKFGQIEEAVEQTIKELSIENLENLGENLLGFTSKEDLEKWLETNKLSKQSN